MTNPIVAGMEKMSPLSSLPTFHTSPYSAREQDALTAHFEVTLIKDDAGHFFVSCMFIVCLCTFLDTPTVRMAFPLLL